MTGAGAGNEIEQAERRHEPYEVVDLINEAIAPDEAPAAAAPAAAATTAAAASAAGSQEADTDAPIIVAVTACPTGIAHTFMAAEGLRRAAEQLGHTMKVETQGSVGAKTRPTSSGFTGTRPY